MSEERGNGFFNTFAAVHLANEVQNASKAAQEAEEFARDEEWEDRQEQHQLRLAESKALVEKARNYEKAYFFSKRAKKRYEKELLKEFKQHQKKWAWLDELEEIRKREHQEYLKRRQKRVENVRLKLQGKLTPEEVWVNVQAFFGLVVIIVFIICVYINSK